MVFKSRLLENYCCLYNALHCKIHRYVSAVTCMRGRRTNSAEKSALWQSTMSGLRLGLSAATGSEGHNQGLLRPHVARLDLTNSPPSVEANLGTRTLYSASTKIYPCVCKHRFVTG